MNMKRIKLKLATAILLGSLMSSCYEDKGNYDYEQMNDITVEIPQEILEKDYDRNIDPQFKKALEVIRDKN